MQHDRRTRNQILQLVRPHGASFVLDDQACNEPQTGNAHRLDHALPHVPLILHLKLACTSDRPAKLEMAKLKTVALNNLCLEIQDRFKGLELNEMEDDA